MESYALVLSDYRAPWLTSASSNTLLQPKASAWSSVTIPRPAAVNSITLDEGLTFGAGGDVRFSPMEKIKGKQFPK